MVTLGVAACVPILFALCGAMGRKLVRGSAWRQSDFHLGVELTLATFSADLVFILETARSNASGFGATQVNAAVVFLAVVLAAYVWLLTLHQDWENNGQPKHGQFLRLGFLSNLAGLVLFATFVFMVKGVR